jgi:hypothetical protein
MKNLLLGALLILSIFSCTSEKFQTLTLEVSTDIYSSPRININSYNTAGVYTTTTKKSALVNTRKRFSVVCHTGYIKVSNSSSTFIPTRADYVLKLDGKVLDKKKQVMSYAYF